jgi:osmotically-inducible protein OsmY
MWLTDDFMNQLHKAQDIIDAVKRAFREDPRLGPRFHLDRVAPESDGTLLLEGNVARLSQKKLALLRAAAVPGVVALADRVRVLPAKSIPDSRIRAALRKVFSRVPELADLELREDVAAGVLTTDFRSVAGAVPDARGRIDIESEGGVVTLNGAVPTLVRKRLAGAVAWWVPGVRDVVNGIVVDPPEDDGPDEIEEAVRAVLDRDPAVEASQVKAGVRARTVRLSGLVRSEAERENAETDAWAVFGVDDVVNEIALLS